MTRSLGDPEFDDIIFFFEFEKPDAADGGDEDAEHDVADRVIGDSGSVPRKDRLEVSEDEMLNRIFAQQAAFGAVQNCLDLFR